MRTLFNTILCLSFIFFAAQTNAQNTFPSSGYVGIGTTTPAHNLEIEGASLVIGGTQKHIMHTQSWLTNADALSWAHEISGSWDWDNALVFKTDGSLIKKASSNSTEAIVVFNTAVTGNHHDVFRVMGNGKVFATEVEVLMAANFPDYVFGEQYDLMPLGQLREYIETNKHLPNVPAAEELGDSMELGEMVRLQMEKIEELTLYILELEAEVEALKAKQ